MTAIVSVSLQVRLDHSFYCVRFLCEALLSIYLLIFRYKLIMQITINSFIRINVINVLF